MKKAGLVYNRKHFITKKLSDTEGALSAAFPQLSFIEITRFCFYHLMGKKNNSIKKKNGRTRTVGVFTTTGGGSHVWLRCLVL